MIAATRAQSHTSESANQSASFRIAPPLAPTDAMLGPQADGDLTKDHAGLRLRERSGPFCAGTIPVHRSFSGGSHPNESSDPGTASPWLARPRAGLYLWPSQNPPQPPFFTACCRSCVMLRRLGCRERCLLE